MNYKQQYHLMETELTNLYNQIKLYEAKDLNTTPLLKRARDLEFRLLNVEKDMRKVLI